MRGTRLALLAVFAVAVVLTTVSLSRSLLPGERGPAAPRMLHTADVFPGLAPSSGRRSPGPPAPAVALTFPDGTTAGYLLGSHDDLADGAAQWEGRGGGGRDRLRLSVTEAGWLAGVGTHRGRYFEVVPVGEGAARIAVPSAPGDLGPVEVALRTDVVDTSPPPAPLRREQPAVERGPAKIDVLFVLEGRLSERSTARVWAAVDEANLVFETSGLDVTVRPAAIEDTQGRRLQPTLDTVYADEAIRTRRDATGADVVSFWTSSPEFAACGVGWLYAPGTDAAVHLVRDDCAPGGPRSELTFAHELGHNLGADHDRAHTPVPGGASHGYVDPGGRYRTVMAYAGTCGGCRRLPFLSSPGFVRWGGDRIRAGTTREDNTAAVRANAHAVAAFRSPARQAQPDKPSPTSPA